MTAPRVRLVELLGALALASLVGCHGGQDSPGDVGDTEGPPVYGASGSSFLSKVSGAPFEVPYRGVRYVELHYGPDPVIYREDVGSDGEGQFFVDPLEIVSSPSPPGLFQDLLALRQVYLYRERDWRIDDYDRFQLNYGVSVLENVQVAGIDCVRVMVSRVLTSPSHYLVDIDPDTGIVLRWEERDGQDNLLALVEFESFEYDGDISGKLLVDRVFTNTTTHPIDGDLESIFGFSPVIPTIMPAPGVALSPEVDRFVDPNGDVWAKVTMTDGLETAMILSRAPEGPAKPQPSRVVAIQLGSWVGMEGEVNGQHVRVAGKFPLALLQLTLESAF